MRANYHFQELTIPMQDVELGGELTMPPEAKGIVIFSHGSGSSRFSSRNKWVAGQLLQHHIGTLLFDLLTEEEDMHYSNRFNIPMLSDRLVAVTEWLEAMPVAGGCGIGYFGASTGAASALNAAAILPQVKAVVSRGGRPDMAMRMLPLVRVPVLLIVGSLDYEVIELNRKAYDALNCEKQLKIIDGATHLFEEPGTLAKVADEAILWFEKYLMPTQKPAYVYRQN